MAYDVGVRQFLQDKGVANNDIGYDQNSGNVTVKGQNFYKPELNMAGTTYSNRQNLDNAYGNYTKQQPQNTGMINAAGSAAGVDAGAGQGGSSTGGTPTSGTGQTFTNPYTQQISDIMTHLSNAANAASQPVDAYNSPQYAAAQAAQARTSQLAMRQANEQAAGAGLGHSTIMTDRSQRIQDDSNNYLQTQLVPQIISQMQAQRQQELQNQQSMFNNVFNLSNQADSQHNADRTYGAGRQDAATTATGYYNPSGMNADQINQEIAKNSAAYSSANPEVQQQLHARNVYLNGLIGKTDSTGNGDYVGGNPNGNVGFRTLAGQTLDLNNAKDMAMLTGKMPDGTPTSAQQQLDLANEWKASEASGVITPKLAQMYGLQPNTPTEQAKQFAISSRIQQQQADTSAAGVANSFALGNRNADISQQNADTNAANSTRADTQQKQAMLMEEWRNSGVAPAGIDNVPQGTALYDRTAAQRAIMDAYKTWRDSGKAPAGIPDVTEGTPYYNATAANRADFNAKESAVISQFDTVPKANLKAAIQDHKSQIVGQVGQAGYDKIYNSYFDPITGALR